MSTIEPRVERLRKAGLRVTGPRLAILGAVEQDRRHPSAEDLHRKLVGDNPSLSLSTVYTTLQAFVRAGLVRRMPEVDGRLRVDGVPDDHDHAICRRCGAVFDVDRDRHPVASAPDTVSDGLAVLDMRVEYDVICHACAEA